MSPTCLLLCTPMLTTGDTEIFITAITKSLKERQVWLNVTRACIQCPAGLEFNTYANAVYWRELLCVFDFQDVPCREATKHQPGVPDHRCQGNVLVLWPQATQTGRTTVYPFTWVIKSQHRVTFPFHFPALHPSLNNSGPLNPQHKDTHYGVCNRSPVIVHRWTVNQVHGIWKPFSYYLRIRRCCLDCCEVCYYNMIKVDEKLQHKNQTAKIQKVSCGYVALSDLQVFCIAKP